MINPGIKSIQHQKAMGNARAQSRGSMFPIFYSSSPMPWDRDTTVYGPEESIQSPADFDFSQSSNSGVLASGRLESISVNEATSIVNGIHITQKEVYRLYWLPWDYNEDPTVNDWTIGNPPRSYSAIAGLDPLARFLLVGMTIWLPSEADSNPRTGYEAGIEYQNMIMTAFKVLDAPINMMGDHLEYVAIVARVEYQGIMRIASQ
jgi:hypothetical protein